MATVKPIDYCGFFARFLFGNHFMCRDHQAQLDEQRESEGAITGNPPCNSMTPSHERLPCTPDGNAGAENY